MSLWIPQRDRIAAAVEAITVDSAGDPITVGRVHKHPVFGHGEQHIVEVGGVPQLRSWELTIAEEGVSYARLTQGFTARRWPWEIIGYFGIDDEDDSTDVVAISEDADAANPRTSYDLCLELAELVADTVMADQTLGGTALDMLEEPTIEQPVPVTIGDGYFAWGVVVRFTTYTETAA